MCGPLVFAARGFAAHTHLHGLLYLDPPQISTTALGASVEAEALRKSAFCLGVFHYMHLRLLYQDLATQFYEMAAKDKVCGNNLVARWRHRHGGAVRGGRRPCGGRCGAGLRLPASLVAVL